MFILNLKTMTFHCHFIAPEICSLKIGILRTKDWSWRSQANSNKELSSRYLVINAHVWVGTGSEPLSLSTLSAPSLQSPQLWQYPTSIPQQPSPLPGALFHPRPPLYRCRLSPVVAVPGFIILSYSVSPGNDILLALTPPANQAVYTPVRQSAYCCCCPLISPGPPPRC